jgi:tetratricopeptide (TPR) repeat protein
MARARWPLALVLLAAGMADARAQIILSYDPYSGGTFVYGPGVRWFPHRRHHHGWLLGPPPVAVGVTVNSVSVVMPPPAVAADPVDPRAPFLLAQAQFALGKYFDAVHAIQAGMDRRKDWPTARFGARELYGGNEGDFRDHLKRLEEAAEAQPRDRFLLFLLAYELWFDGKRERAAIIFRRAKKLTRNPAYIDPFLTAAGR